MYHTDTGLHGLRENTTRIWVSADGGGVQKETEMRREALNLSSIAYLLRSIPQSAHMSKTMVLWSHLSSITITAMLKHRQSIMLMWPICSADVY